MQFLQDFIAFKTSIHKSLKMLDENKKKIELANTNLQN